MEGTEAGRWTSMMASHKRLLGDEGCGEKGGGGKAYAPTEGRGCGCEPATYRISQAMRPSRRI